MKKLITILLAALLLVTLFGCSGNSDSPTANSLWTESPTDSTTTDTSEDQSESSPTISDDSEETTDKQPNKDSSATGGTTPTEKATSSTKNPPQNNNNTTGNNSNGNDTTTPSQPKQPDPPVTVTLSLDKSSITLDVGQTATIKATVSPGGTAVSWESGEDSIATVSNGTVTGKGAGITVIIVKAGGQEKRCTVTVKQPAAPFSPGPYETYAITEGKKLGLKHDEAFVSKNNWNPWINLSSSLTDAQMKQNIRDSLQILINEGREYFFVYAEPQTNGSYHLYIYYG